jgi:D-alanine-D-alanine ligase
MRPSERTHALSATIDHPFAFWDSGAARARRDRIRAAAASRRVAVLMGGDTGEREVSLRSGQGVAAALQAGTEAHVTAVDVDYARLHDADLGGRFDLAYIALHGGKGECGALQGYLECLGLPFTGPGPLGCAIAMDKVVGAEVLRAAGVGVPELVPVGPDADVEALAREAEAALGVPAVVKPRAEGSSLGVAFCHTPAELREGIAMLRRDFGGGIVCRLIPEPEVTVGVVHGHAFPALELVSHHEFYDYEAKYTKGLTDFIVPARLAPDVTARVLDTAQRSAEVLECGTLCRVDMRIDADGRPWVLDVNPSPGMTETSDLPAEAEALGVSYAELVVEVLGTALVRAGAIDSRELR